MDALRIIAAVVVVAEHYLGDWGIVKLGIGRYGVDVFFAISGFLITLILLRQKSGRTISVVKNFFMRRVLRLFPSYYLFLGSMFIFGLATGLWISDSEHVWYYFTYTPNILFFQDGYQSSVLNHTWSLGIEEQFYLVWPWLILMIPRSMALFTFVTITFTGLFVRAILPELVDGLGEMKFLPPGNFHTLGIGSVLAYVVYSEKERLLSLLSRINPYILSISFCGFLMNLAYFGEERLLNEFLIMVLSATLVFQSYIGFGGVFKPFFDNTKIQYLGKISYGIYLYHKPLPLILILVSERLNVEIPQYLGLAVCLILTFIISHLSWKYMEKPILKLKSKYV